MRIPVKVISNTFELLGYVHMYEKCALVNAIFACVFVIFICAIIFSPYIYDNFVLDEIRCGHRKMSIGLANGDNVCVELAFVSHLDEGTD